MKNIENFFLTAEAEVRSKIFLIIASMVLSLICPIGMWLTTSLIYSANLEVHFAKYTAILGFTAALLTLLFCMYIAFRSINFWQTYSYRFSEEENIRSNQLDEYADYIYPSLLRHRVVSDFRLLIYIWFIASLMFTIAFAFPILKIVNIGIYSFDI